MIIPAMSCEDLRATFEQVPELYDRARPRYPNEVFEDLSALLPARARVVEIGCGTGQATVPLAQRGFRITCVALGGGLGAVALGTPAPFRDSAVLNPNSERWAPPH